MYIKLFDGENLESIYESNDTVNEFNPQKINEKYVKGEIRIITEQARYPLPSIEDMVKSGKYNLNPDFQRRYRWSDEKKSKLIESFIINVPVPPIFLYEIEFAKYEVMDGLQRMTAINEFYKDNYKLQGLEQWKELNGLRYSELPEKIKEGIDRRYLSSIVLLYETAKSAKEAQFMKQLVFERLNSGGEYLTPQETRNALYAGNLNKLCVKISSNSSFRKMWGIPEPTENRLFEDELSDDLTKDEKYSKMQDVELVLRFFALRHIEFVEYTSLERYFDNFLSKGNSFSQDLLNKYEELFNETIDLIYNIFEENAFNLFRQRNGKWIWYNRPTKAIYDPMMRVFSQNLHKKEVLISRKDKVLENLPEFYIANYSDFGGRSNNKNDIIKRTKLFQEYISKFLD